MNEMASKHAASVGDDCLRERNRPGTPVGECIYIFCGCHVHEAHIAGARDLAAILLPEIEKLKKEVWYLKNQDGAPYPEGDE